MGVGVYAYFLYFYVLDAIEPSTIFVINKLCIFVKPVTWQCLKRSQILKKTNKQTPQVETENFMLEKVWKKGNSLALLMGM